MWLDSMPHFKSNPAPSAAASQARNQGRFVSQPACIAVGCAQQMPPNHHQQLECDLQLQSLSFWVEILVVPICTLIVVDLAILLLL